MHLRCSADLSLVVADRQWLLYIDGAHWFNYIACNKLAPAIIASAARKSVRKLASMPANTRDTRDEPEEAAAPHYHVHRMRLREHFHGAGPDALSDYELLEMVLFTAQPRRDMKPLAKTLLKKFGSFAEVIHAPEPRLREVKGIGDASINQLKLSAAAASRIAKGPLQGRTLL